MLRIVLLLESNLLGKKKRRKDQRTQKDIRMIVIYCSAGSKSIPQPQGILNSDDFVVTLSLLFCCLLVCLEVVIEAAIV